MVVVNINSVLVFLVIRILAINVVNCDIVVVYARVALRPRVPALVAIIVLTRRAQDLANQSIKLVFRVLLHCGVKTSRNGAKLNTFYGCGLLMQNSLLNG